MIATKWAPPLLQPSGSSHYLRLNNLTIVRVVNLAISYCNTNKQSNSSGSESCRTAPLQRQSHPEKHVLSVSNSCSQARGGSLHQHCPRQGASSPSEAHAETAPDSLLSASTPARTLSPAKLWHPAKLACELGIPFCEVVPKPLTCSIIPLHKRTTQPACHTQGLAYHWL